MIPNFKKRVRNIIIFLIALFLIMFSCRLWYGYTLKLGDSNRQSQVFDVSSLRKNYASKKYKVKSTNATQSAVQVDQKYEKIAEINTKSSEFEKEEKLLRQEVKDQKGLIQFEKKGGNEGYRKLNMLIGVPPENFDILYQNLIKIGKVQTKSIIKKDKTNEYKELNSKKASLEKIRNSLIELKSKGGKIEEYINLENRILEIEQQLQGLGVSLGNFDDENEFCTIKFSLLEGKIKKISLQHRLKVAFEWTVKYYLALVAILFFASLFSYLFLLIIDKFKLLQKIFNK